MLNRGLVARAVACIAVVFALAGCVLESSAPLFSEEQGELALKPLGTRFVGEAMENGQWKSDGAIGIFTASGRHYVLSSEKDDKTTDLLFVPMGNARYVLQMQDDSRKGEPYVYLIADVADGHAMLSILDCDQLKKLGGLEESIAFDGSDCRVKGNPGLALFSSLASQIAPAKMRLTPVK